MCLNLERKAISAGDTFLTRQVPDQAHPFPRPPVNMGHHIQWCSVNTVKHLTKSWAIYFANQWLNSISRKLHGEVGAGRGSIAALPLQLSISTSHNRWSTPFGKGLIRNGGRNVLFHCGETSVSTSSHICTILSCVLLNTTFCKKLRKSSDGIQSEKGQLSKYFHSAICVLDIRITKYTNHVTLTQFSLKAIFANGC